MPRMAHAVLWRNISLALGIKVAFRVLTKLGSATMWRRWSPIWARRYWSWPMACASCDPDEHPFRHATSMVGAVPLT